MEDKFDIKDGKVGLGSLLGKMNNNKTISKQNSRRINLPGMSGGTNSKENSPKNALGNLLMNKMAASLAN